jgi:hypothetical protein
MNRIAWALRIAVIAESISHRLLPRIAPTTLQVSAEICRSGMKTQSGYSGGTAKAAAQITMLATPQLLMLVPDVCKRLFHTSLVNSLRLHWHCYILHNLTHHLIGLL